MWNLGEFIEFNKIWRCSKKWKSQRVAKQYIKKKPMKFVIQNVTLYIATSTLTNQKYIVVKNAIYCTEFFMLFKINCYSLMSASWFLEFVKHTLWNTNLIWAPTFQLFPICNVILFGLHELRDVWEECNGLITITAHVFSVFAFLCNRQWLRSLTLSESAVLFSIDQTFTQGDYHIVQE